MGSCSSALAGLTEDQLDEYVQLTYLRKPEIVKILKKFIALGPDKMQANFHHRFHATEIMEAFPVLKYNPFGDRLFRVFSSEQDERMSFEDLLDLCSAVAEQCPDRVKAAWAFRVFDFDEDSQINSSDIFQAVDRLTWSDELSTQDKQKIADSILEQLDVYHTRSMALNEFQHVVSKMPEFCHSFYFKV